MIKKGIVSVTFRQFTPEKIIELAKENGLSYIEWGSDVHVPAGNMEKAAEVATLMEKAGMESVSYGTYYRLGTKNKDEFVKYLEQQRYLVQKTFVFGRVLRKQKNTPQRKDLNLPMRQSSFAKLHRSRG